jgi:hypothetical protein
MAVQVTTYAYPWDLARRGVEATLREVRDGEIDGIELAATYHPIDALSPRDGLVRLFSSGRGAVHFPARPARYGRIRPSVSAPEVTAAWPEAAERARDLGLLLNSWTVLTYQPWIVDAHPDCARVLPSGDRTDAGVCPAHDDVREYVAALCEDIVDQFGVHTLHLEGAAAVSYDYGWLRPRILVDVPPVARELLAVCFCESCSRSGVAAGLDVERVRRLVNQEVAAQMGDPAAGESRAQEVLGDDELRAFVVRYERASIDLVRLVRERLGGRPTRISSTVWTPFSTLFGDAHDDLVAELAAVADQLLVFPRWRDERTRRVAALAAAGGSGVELASLFTPKENGSTAALPADASVKDGERVDDELRAAADFGVRAVGIYNYGLLPERELRGLAAAIRRVFDGQSR